MEKSETLFRGFVGKCQLAMAYAPELTCKSALNRLHEWLHYSPQLIADLRASGYKERQKFFTPRQVRIIYDHLGEP